MIPLHYISSSLRFIFPVCLIFVSSFQVKAAARPENVFIVRNDSVFLISTEEDVSRPNPILTLFKTKQKKNKKLTAALLAFPFPFGMVGLHRIYLGTAPYVPVVYIGTLGGALGILPFIDFCVLMLDKDIDHYTENKNVLMWVQENAKRVK